MQCIQCEGELTKIIAIYRQTTSGVIYRLVYARLNTIRTTKKHVIVAAEFILLDIIGHDI